MYSRICRAIGARQVSGSCCRSRRILPQWGDGQIWDNRTYGGFSVSRQTHRRLGVLACDYLHWAYVSPSKARSQCHRPTIQDPMVVPRDRLVHRLLRARPADPRVVSYTVSDRKRKAAARADAADEAKLVPPPANDDRKPAILIIRRKSRFGRAEDLTVEEIQCRRLCHLIQLGGRHHPLKDFIAGCQTLPTIRL